MAPPKDITTTTSTAVKNPHYVQSTNAGAQPGLTLPSNSTFTYNKDGTINSIESNPGWTGAGGYLSTGAQVFNAAAAGMSAYTGYQALGLAKDEFAFKKNATNRDIANQGKLINNDIVNSNNVGLALAGNTLTSEQQAASRLAAQSRQVNTSAIG